MYTHAYLYAYKSLLDLCCFVYLKNQNIKLYFENVLI